MSESTLHSNEALKENSNFLRGTILESLADTSTGAICKEDSLLTKFHGTYMQDDRDLRRERRKAKQEPAYSFMIRVRVPGGVCTPKQWLEMDRLSTTYANHSLKLTTRQVFQFHGVIKSNLKKTIREINDALLDTIAACGDVNRNVMCNPNPHQSEAHAEIYELAKSIGAHMLPRSHAYHDIWLTDENGEKTQVTSDVEEEEPIYGKTYLPRKFKIVVAVPPSNDVDVYAHDLGFIAILDDNKKIVGYNITVGGGMGMSHGKEQTFPRLADVMGFCTPDQVIDVAEKIVLVQRDHGDRTDRSHARFKYTVEDHGVDWIREQTEQRLGYKLEAARDFHFEDNGDRYGWIEDYKGNHHLTLFVQNGRVRDDADLPYLTGLREIAKIHTGDFRITANQNLIIANVTNEQRPKIEALLEQYKIKDSHLKSALRLNSMACVALPTCGLSLAESERYLPDLITELEEVIEEVGLKQDAITIRMTGCPNGCARPYISEIAFVGRAPGKYNVYLGGGFTGNRLNKLYKASVLSTEIKDLLAPIIRDYAQKRTEGERFGDFVIRTGVIAETKDGRDFHQGLKD